MSVQALVSRLERQSRLYLVEATVLDARVIAGEHVEADVRLVPEGVETTAQTVSAAGGEGGGLYRVPQSGESVICGCVGGEPGNCYLLSALFDESTSPPSRLEPGRAVLQACEDEELEIVGEGGETIVRITTDGEVVVEASTAIVDSDDIRLGGDQPGDNEALAGPTNSNFQAHSSWDAGHVHLYVLPLIPTGTAPTASPTSPPPSPSDVSSSKVRSD